MELEPAVINFVDDGSCVDAVKEPPSGIYSGFHKLHSTSLDFHGVFS